MPDPDWVLKRVEQRWREAESELSLSLAREQALRELGLLLAERVERDLHEPDKILCNLLSFRSALSSTGEDG